MNFKTNKFFNILLTVLVLFLIIPTSAILASWNSLPGSSLYPVKRSLEKFSLSLIPNSLWEMNFRFKLIDRRFDEAITSWFDNNSDQGLTAMVEEARNMELAFEDLSPQTQIQIQTKAVTKLKQTSQKLKTVQQQHLIPIHQPETQPSSPAPAPVQNPVDQTQKDLDDIIQNLENRINELEQQSVLPSPSVSPTPIFQLLPTNNILFSLDEAPPPSTNPSVSSPTPAPSLPAVLASPDPSPATVISSPSLPSPPQSVSPAASPGL